MGKKSFNMQTVQHLVTGKDYDGHFPQNNSQFNRVWKGRSESPITS